MIRPYLPGDMWTILPFIRQSELNEAEALGENPEQSIASAVMHGETVTLELNGEIAGLAGVVPRDGYLMPWAVFTDAVDSHPVKVLRDSKRWMDRYNGPMLNVVDERNQTAQRWLGWLGFTLGDPVPYGPEGRLFRFYWKNCDMGVLH